MAGICFVLVLAGLKIGEWVASKDSPNNYPELRRFDR